MFGGVPRAEGLLGPWRVTPRTAPPSEGSPFTIFLSPGCFSELCTCPTQLQPRPLAIWPRLERNPSPSPGRRELEAPPGWGARGANFSLRTLLRSSAAALRAQGTRSPR